MCVCVCALHTQQLILLLVCIIRLLAPQLLRRALFWLPSLSTLLPASDHPVVTPRSSLASALCRLLPSPRPSRRCDVWRKWSEVESSDCCTVMPWSKRHHCLQGRLSLKCVWHGAITLISFHPPPPLFCLSFSLVPSSS